MTGSTIASLDSIIKVLYDKDGELRSFLTIRNNNTDYRLYLKPRGHRYYYSKEISLKELEEIKELLKSPIEKIDLDQLEKF